MKNEKIKLFECKKVNTGENPVNTDFRKELRNSQITYVTVKPNLINKVAEKPDPVKTFLEGLISDEYRKIIASIRARC